MTDNKELSEIETVSIREYFEDEERDFTPWLQDNIDKLSSEDLLYLSLDEAKREVSLGGVEADLIAEASGQDLTIVIENQFEETDPDHLGRSLVYASGTDADVVVWIAEEFRERHTRTIRWLNSTTNEDVAFFAIEVTLRKIGDSPYGVEFQPNERPDDWEQQVQKEYLSPPKQRRLQFWREFQDEYQEYGIEGGKAKEVASHSVYVFRSNKRPAYVRPTVDKSAGAKNMIRFYEDARDISQNETGRAKFETALEETVSNLDTELTTDISDSLRWDIDSGRDFDKVVLEHRDANHNQFENDQKVDDITQWMIDTTRALRGALLNLAQEGQIQAEPR